MTLYISHQEAKVIEITSPRKFHRLFTLSATENHEPLKISYSIAGPEDGDFPTILFVGGMFCTRWHNILCENLAQKEGVRIISTDRSVLQSNPNLSKSHPQTTIFLWIHMTSITISLIIPFRTANSTTGPDSGRPPLFH